MLGLKIISDTYHLWLISYSIILSRFCYCNLIFRLISCWFILCILWLLNINSFAFNAALFIICLLYRRQRLVRGDEFLPMELSVGARPAFSGLTNHRLSKIVIFPIIFFLIITIACFNRMYFPACTFPIIFILYRHLLFYVPYVSNLFAILNQESSIIIYSFIILPIYIPISFKQMFLKGCLFNFKGIIKIC